MASLAIIIFLLFSTFIKTSDAYVVIVGNRYPARPVYNPYPYRYYRSELNGN